MRTRIIPALLLAVTVPWSAAGSGLDRRPVNETCLAAPAWQGNDVGAVVPAGRTGIAASGTTVHGSGADIWGQADAFHFLHQPLTGDGEISARIVSLSPTDPWAKAGVMLRETTAPGSRFALMLMTPGANGAAFHYRTSTGGSAGPPASGDGVSRLPRWVRIVRRGDRVEGWHSADGSTWTLRDSVNLALPDTVQVGLAVTSHDNGTLAAARFEHVRVVLPAGDDAAGITASEAWPAAPAFSQPTKLLQAPNDASRWYVVEKSGRVLSFTAGAPAQAQTWLDLSGRIRTAYEGGLLGLAFHPDFPQPAEVYVSYTAPGPGSPPMRSVVSRLKLDDPLAPGQVVEEVLLTVDQPYDNHNGGEIVFGPDRRLYIGLGDGGSGGDPHGHGQRTTTLLGSMLRIDVLGVGWPLPRYGIPEGNPFRGNARCGPGANAAPCPEIYAWGFRNPWRFSFDRETGALWAGDVGQNAREEVNLVVAGGNYGWNCREGSLPFNGSCPGGVIDPVVEYAHGDGDGSVTGGFVYRGASLAELRGRYVFGDFVSGRIRALSGSSTQGADILTDTPSSISTFGEGADGELYFADYGSGRLYRLDSGAGPAHTVPEQLAATGCVDPSDPRRAASGLVPYGVNFPFWSDGAAKERHLALPPNGLIEIDPAGRWRFPEGTVLVKSMQLDGRPVETRLLMRHAGGAWAGYTWAWDEAGTTPTRLREGGTRNFGGRTWIYPSEAQCPECHTGAAGHVLGLETAQMNRDFHYAETGRMENQIATYSHIGLFAGSAGDPAALPRLPAGAFDPDADVQTRARAYLHVNCAGCHRPDGPTPSTLDLRKTTSLAGMNACNAPPLQGDLGIAGAKLIWPGDPLRSLVLRRMARRDAHGMPPLASAQVDTDGVWVLADWISGLDSCEEAGSCH